MPIHRRTHPVAVTVRPAGSTPEPVASGSHRRRRPDRRSRHRTRCRSPAQPGSRPGSCRHGRRHRPRRSPRRTAPVRTWPHRQIRRHPHPRTRRARRPGRRCRRHRSGHRNHHRRRCRFEFHRRVDRCRSVIAVVSGRAVPVDDITGRESIPVCMKSSDPSQSWSIRVEGIGLCAGEHRSGFDLVESVEGFELRIDHPRRASQQSPAPGDLRPRDPQGSRGTPQAERTRRHRRRIHIALAVLVDAVMPGLGRIRRDLGPGQPGPGVPDGIPAVPVCGGVPVASMSMTDQSEPQAGSPRAASRAMGAAIVRMEPLDSMPQPNARTSPEECPRDPT